MGFLSRLTNQRRRYWSRFANHDLSRHFLSSRILERASTNLSISSPSTLSIVIVWCWNPPSRHIEKSRGYIPRDELGISASEDLPFRSRDRTNRFSQNKHLPYFNIFSPFPNTHCPAHIHCGQSCPHSLIENQCRDFDWLPL